MATLRQMGKGRGLLREASRHLTSTPAAAARTLCFADTLGDQAGPYTALAKVAPTAPAGSRVVTCLGGAVPADRPARIVNLPPVAELTLPYGEGYTLRIPSLLRSLQALWDLDPDEVFIATPGPVGLLGLLVARLLDVRTAGLFNLAALERMEALIGDETIAGLLRGYVHWLYGALDSLEMAGGERKPVPAAERGGLLVPWPGARSVPAQPSAPASA